MQYLLSTQNAGSVLPSGMVSFALSVWPETFPVLNPSPDSYHKLGILHQSTEPIFTDFTKNFDVVTSDLYLTYFFLQGNLCMLYCAYKNN